jgi:hypothetical protein
MFQLRVKNHDIAKPFLFYVPLIFFFSIITCEAQVDDKYKNELTERFIKAGIAVKGENAHEWSSYQPPCATIEILPNGFLYVYLYDNDIRDLSLLKDMPIYELYVRGKSLKDISDLLTPSLRKVLLFCSSLTDISHLHRSKLSELAISFTPIQDVSLIEGLSLERFSFNPYAATNDLRSVKWPKTLRRVAIARDAKNGLSDSWPISLFRRLMSMWWERDNPGDSALTKSDVSSLPISLSLTVYAENMISKPWHFRSEENVGASLFHCSDKSGRQISEEKQVEYTNDDMDAIRQLLINMDFFNLRDEYGAVTVSSTGGRVISIRCGRKQKTIELYCLNPDNKALDELDSNIVQLQKLWEYIESSVGLPPEHAAFIGALRTED